MLLVKIFIFILAILPIVLVDGTAKGDPKGAPKGDPKGAPKDEYVHLEVLKWLAGNYTYARDIVVERRIPTGIFDANVKGYIVPVGPFPDLDETIDYFYGPFASLPPGYNASAHAYSFRNYVESGNVAAFSLDATYLFPVLNNFTFTGFVEFTNSTRSATIKRYNLAISRASEWYRHTGQPLAGKYFDAAYRESTINQICTLHQLNCTSQIEHRQYADYQECHDFLSSIEFGTAELAYENTTFCRKYHAPMVAARPAVHCPHIGRSGGMFCTGVRNYTEYYSEPINAPMIAPPVGKVKALGFVNSNSVELSSVVTPQVGTEAVSTGQIAAIVGAVAAVATLFGLLAGMALLMTVQRYQKKSKTGSQKSSTVVVQDGMTEEYDVKLLGSVH